MSATGNPKSDANPLVLITGATGKVGQTFIRRVTADLRLLPQPCRGRDRSGVGISRRHVKPRGRACRPRQSWTSPWIQEKDDFRCSMRFDDEQFGGALLRNFVHVEDLVSAILIAMQHPRALQETYNICMDEPVSYRHVADYLAETRNLPSVDVPTDYHSTWLDNSKAKFHLEGSPDYDTERLIEEAWRYERGPDEPWVIYYPGSAPLGVRGSEIPGAPGKRRAHAVRTPGARPPHTLRLFLTLRPAERVRAWLAGQRRAARRR